MIHFGKRRRKLAFLLSVWKIIGGKKIENFQKNGVYSFRVRYTWITSKIDERFHVIRNVVLHFYNFLTF